MLYDKDALVAIAGLLKNKKPNFNIQVFLHLLQSSTRPLGYPPIREGYDTDYYLDLIQKNITKSKTEKNAELFRSSICSLYQIMICFCYMHQTLCSQGKLSAELFASLHAAIEKRAYTTDEERCAEKSLLHMLLDHPTVIIKLIAEYQHQMFFENIPQILTDNINTCGTRQLKNIINSTPALELTKPVSQVLEVIESAYQGLKQFANLSLVGIKANRQKIIGAYLLDHIEDPSNQAWIMDDLFLKSAICLVLQERGRQETMNYINARKEEHALFGIFGKYSKATKLNSADKYYKLLDNEKNIVFSENEREALQNDKDSRLTDIYSRYKAITPNL